MKKGVRGVNGMYGRYRRAFFIGRQLTRSFGRPRAARGQGHEQTGVLSRVSFRRATFSRSDWHPPFDHGMLTSMSPFRTFALLPPSPDAASFYAFFFYAVTSPADRMRA